MNTIPQLFNAVYMLTNPVGERYIGSAVDLRNRMGEHKRGETGLCESVAKYGWENHTLTILAHDIPDDILRAREKEFIRKLKPEINKMKWCGGRLRHAESSKQLMSAASKGKPKSPKHRAKLSEALRGEKSPYFGKPRSPETRAKLSAANAGKPKSAEHRAKLSAANKGRSAWNKGKPRSPETRAKLSAALKGKKLSPETRAKMRMSARECANIRHKHRAIKELRAIGWPVAA